MPRARKPKTAALVPTGAPYGQRSANEALASQITATSPTSAPAAAASPVDASQAALNMNFQPPVGLADPTQRPGEPLTAGMDIGAGVGSDSLMNPSSSLTAATDQVGQTLRDLYLHFPYPGIRELIEDHDNAG